MSFKFCLTYNYYIIHTNIVLTVHFFSYLNNLIGGSSSSSVIYCLSVIFYANTTMPPAWKDVRFVLSIRLFVGGLMSYLRYLCLFACSVFFSSFFSILCTLWWQFHWIVHFWLPLLYSLTFILNQRHLTRSTNLYYPHCIFV